MHKTFIKALSWNSSATFVYKIALLSHQILLYSIISNTIYGLQSTLFAGIYTVMALTNFGFEETLLPFFSTFSQSKQQFRQTWHHFILHIFTVALIATILCIIMLYGYGAFLHKMRMYCNRNLIFVLVMIFFIESVKKSIIAMMQLAFLNKQIAYANLSMLITYIACVWTIFNLHRQLTLYDIFVPMLITSTLELSYLFYNFLKFYHALPTITQTSKIPFNIIFKQRICNYINQIIKTIYSPNFMTIFFAHLLGFQQAATIKLFTNIITLCYACISKTIGVTTGAAFSAMNQMPSAMVQSFFKNITYRYFQMLLILSLLIMTIVGYSWYTNQITGIMALQIIIFFSISFLEHVSITYEQLLISQQAAWILTILNLSGLIVLLFSHYVCTNQATFICIFITVKLVSLSALSFLTKSRHHQQIQ